jgi:GDP-mannose 6-dehydrogenase
MRVSILGLGYVGTVSGACLAKLGHSVIGVDINPLKVNFINEGKSPIIEKDLPEMIAEATSEKLFRATPSVAEALIHSDISLICVGTPGNSKGNLDLAYVIRVCEEIGKAMQNKPDYHQIVVRSTMLPGSTEGSIIPTLEQASGKKVGADFGVCYNPEFMREGSSVQDFFQPPVTVVGGANDQDIYKVAALYEKIDAPLVRTGYREAEAVKYVCNAFHALKVAFANEIGTVCKELGIDSHNVMDIFFLDRKLNISNAYLKPGFAFGGSCLPKDLRALNYLAKQLDLEIPLLNSILPANQVHLQRALDIIYESKKKKVGMLGLSFKPGTDDLRESPFVTLVETLIGKGFQVKIYDKNISLARLTGSNKEFIEKEIPHIASVLVEDIQEVLSSSEVIVLGNAENEFKRVLAGIRSDQIIIDLARVMKRDSLSSIAFTYHGMCW